MKIYMSVGLKEEVLDGLFDFRGRMVYSNMETAMEVASDDCAIMEGELTKESEIRECLCQGLIGNTYSKLHVKWTGCFKKIAA